jgi:hypothetical protein
LGIGRYHNHKPPFSVIFFTQKKSKIEKNGAITFEITYLFLFYLRMNAKEETFDSVQANSYG